MFTKIDSFVIYRVPNVGWRRAPSNHTAKEVQKHLRRMRKLGINVDPHRRNLVTITTKFGIFHSYKLTTH